MKNVKQDKNTFDVIQETIANPTNHISKRATTAEELLNNSVQVLKVAKKPDWAKLKAGYPVRGTADDIFTYVFCNNNRGWVNTCATRVSIALLKAGVNITGGWYVNKDSQLHKDLKVKSGLRKRVVINVHEMKKFLTQTYGKPNVVITPNTQNSEVYIEDVRRKITGKTGIMLMEGIHVTLWDKTNGIRGEWDYCTCKRVHFWQI